MKYLNSIKFDDEIRKDHCIFEMNSSFKTMPVDPEEVDDPEGTNDPEDVECCVEIDMLRTGKFLRRTWFGDSVLVNIDEAMMDTMIKNFDNKVMPQGVALDTNHRGEESYGWLQDGGLRKEKRMVKGYEQTFLIGKFALTPAGKNIIKDQSYKHFSIEFMPNMTQKEVYETTKTPEGKEIPLGDVKNYGPTIIGGALTNRPFIPDMKAVPMAFSESEEFKKDPISKFVFISGEENVVVLDEAKPKSSGGSFKPVVNSKQSEENKPTIIPNIPKKGFDLSGFSFKKEPDMKFAAMKNMIKFMEEKLGKTDKDSTEFKEVESNLKSVREELALAEKADKEREDLVKANEQNGAAYSELASKFVTLENNQKATAAELLLSKERSRQADINQYTESLNGKGFTKPLVDKVKEYLLSDKSEAEVLKLTNETTKTSTSLKLKDVISGILECVPASGLVPMGEESKYHEQENPEEKKAKDAATKFSEANKDAIDAGHKAATARYKRNGKPDVDQPKAEKVTN